MNELIWLFVALLGIGTFLLAIKKNVELEMEKRITKWMALLFLVVGSIGCAVMVVLYFFVDAP